MLVSKLDVALDKAVGHFRRMEGLCKGFYSEKDGYISLGLPGSITQPSTFKHSFFKEAVLLTADKATQCSVLLYTGFR